MFYPKGYYGCVIMDCYRRRLKSYVWLFSCFYCLLTIGSHPRKKSLALGLFDFALVANMKCTALVLHERASRKANSISIRIMATASYKKWGIKTRHETIAHNGRKTSAILRLNLLRLAIKQLIVLPSTNKSLFTL